MTTTHTLTVADLKALNAMAVMSEAEGFRFMRRFVDDLAANRVRLDDRCEFFLGAFDAEQLVGVGGVTRDPYVDDPLIGRLRHVYVRRESRHAGIGRLIVAHIEARAEPCYTHLRLRTDSVVAARFYERLGYQMTNSSSATHYQTLRAGAAAPAC